MDNVCEHRSARSVTAARDRQNQKKQNNSSSPRRDFLRQATLIGGAFSIPILAVVAQEDAYGSVGIALNDIRNAGERERQDRKNSGKADEGAEKISPAEDLMREHGVLNRILLIYDECLRRLSDNGKPAKPDFDLSVLANAAEIVRRFVEQYHEKLEEDFLFPRFRAAGKLIPLVDTLQSQHRAGRGVTAQIREMALTPSLRYVSNRDRLADALHSFLRMYRPHEAREDTVLFPAFRKIVSAHEYDALDEEFEKKEDELFGEEGFFKIVDQVAGLEKKIGLYDLAQFTPE